jgi:hypothetical protein
LNYVFRKNKIQKINEENNQFLNKLSHVKSTVPDVRKLEKIHFDVSAAKSLRAF